MGKMTDKTYTTQRFYDIAGFKVEVIRKTIKNIHLYVFADGKIRVSAPLKVPQKRINEFILSKSNWLTKKLRERKGTNEQDSNCLYLWGKRYALKESKSDNVSLCVIGETVHVSGLNKEETDKAVIEFLTRQLSLEIDKKLPFWEEKTGLKCSGWTIRNMLTRWGSCNVNTHKISFSIHLAKRPLECLDYLILHELAHIVFHGHGKDFKDYLSQFMPEWKAKRKLLQSYL